MKTSTDDVVLEPAGRCGGVENWRHRRLRPMPPEELAKLASGAPSQAAA
jgi:hypothetical protein